VGGRAVVREIAPRSARLDEVEDVELPLAGAAVEADALWQRRELESAAFQPRRVGGSGRPATRLAAAWLTGVVALAALGALGSAGVPGTRTDGPAEARDGLAADRATAPRTPSPEPPIAAITVVEWTSSDRPGEGISRWLEVDGQLLVRAQRVRITLEGREDRIIRTIVRQTGDPHGGIRPRQAARFSADFEIPAWRSGGMWVTVTAFDEHGQRLGRLRQRVEVYALEPMAAILGPAA
jgi:hypothetical protein